MPEPIDPIQQAASEPQSATVDGETIANRSIGDLIAADRYLEQKAVAKKGGPGLKLFKLRPGSARGE